MLPASRTPFYFNYCFDPHWHGVNKMLYPLWINRRPYLFELKPYLLAVFWLWGALDGCFLLCPYILNGIEIRRV